MTILPEFQMRRLLRLKSGEFISADNIEEDGAYPVYGGNGLRGFTSNWNTSGPIVLIGRQGALCGNVQVVPGKAWVSEHALRCFPEKPLNVSFLRYVLQSLNLGQYSVSAAQPGLSTDNIKPLLVSFPSPDIQAQIARFLDRKTAQIDGLIAKKQSLLERLAEKRQAIITQAVTTGLNPAAPMKDSGIDWLGQIPAHWEVVPLRRMVLLQRGHDLPAQDREDGDVLLISSAGVIGHHNQKRSDGPGIVTGRYGTIGEFYFVAEPFWPLNTTLYSREITCSPQFAFRLLQAMSHLFVLNSLKSAVPGVDRNDVLSEHVPRPPFDEQVRIADWISEGEKQLAQNSALVERSVAHLTEYRSALITAAVTGQIEELR
jgi:type I restriction enzyme S subunit